jgi:hypothetical protein
MSVYVVVAREHDDICVCEAYAGACQALGRAFQIASDFAGPGRTDLWTAAPEEEKSPNCSVRWEFMDTNKHSVVVFYRPQIETSIPSAKDSISMVAPQAPPPPIHQPLPPFQPSFGPPSSYDFLEPSLPVGWWLDGKPALMEHLLNAPDQIRDPDTLTDAQKWALVTARVIKSPNWKGVPKGSPIPWYHPAALQQLKNKTGIGTLLRDGEIESIRALREDLIAGVKP